MNRFAMKKNNRFTGLGQIISGVFFVIALLSSWNCNIINPPEKTPTYITIDSFSFDTLPNTGTGSQKITSAFVFYNNNSVGTFELPATIPILADAPGKLFIAPGVTYSGLNNYQFQYPYFRFDTTSIEPGINKTFNPTTSYYSTALPNFLMEDFELGNTFIQKSGDTTLSRVNDPNLVFEGSGAGYLYLKAPQHFAESIMSQTFRAQADAYIELNYKCSIPFDVGLFAISQNGQDGGFYFSGFKPRDTWNKVYIGTQDFINTYPNREYRIMISAALGGEASGYVSIDNIKVVTKQQ